MSSNDYVVADGLTLTMNYIVMLVYDFDLAIMNFVHLKIALAYRAACNHDRVRPARMADEDAIVYCVST